MTNQTDPLDEILDDLIPPNATVTEDGIVNKDATMLINAMWGVQKDRAKAAINAEIEKRVHKEISFYHIEKLIKQQVDKRLNAEIAKAEKRGIAIGEALLYTKRKELVREARLKDKFTLLNLSNELADEHYKDGSSMARAAYLMAQADLIDRFIEEQTP